MSMIEGEPKLFEMNPDPDRLPDNELKPAVEMPNSIPKGSRYGQSSESYAIAIPGQISPEWVADAVRQRRERLDKS